LSQGGAKAAPDLASWKEVGKQSQLTVHPAGEGTYLLGVSTMASTSTRTASEFGKYLELEDLPDTLATYDASKFPNGVTYSYTKHARAIGQVGTKLTDDFAASLGYPLEIRLARNPGSVKVGEQLSFQVLQQGTPVPNLLVYVGHRADA
ncbi:cobalt ABC transporter substrate-binding protein, partial [Xanthomonas euvesicatoria]